MQERKYCTSWSRPQWISSQQPLVFTTVFSFWIHLWWCQMLTPPDLRQPALTLPGIYSLWLSPSVVNLITLHSAVRLKHHRARAQSLLVLGLLFLLRLLLLAWEWSAWVRWLLMYGRWFITGILAATISVPSPKPPSPVFPLVSVVLSAPLCQGYTICGCLFQLPI